MGARKPRFPVACHGFSGRKRGCKEREIAKGFDLQGSLTQAGPAVCVQAESGLALAVEGAQGVHTAVLAAPIVHLALVNICKKTRGEWIKPQGRRQEGV